MKPKLFIVTGSKFIEKIEGSKTNIAGLPIDKVLETLKEFI